MQFLETFKEKGHFLYNFRRKWRFFSIFSVNIGRERKSQFWLPLVAHWGRILLEVCHCLGALPDSCTLLCTICDGIYLALMGLHCSCYEEKEGLISGVPGESGLWAWWSGRTPPLYEISLYDFSTKFWSLIRHFLLDLGAEADLGEIIEGRGKYPKNFA